MINTKKIIFIFIIFLLCLTKGNAAIKDSIFATVGNKPITRSDIINEIKTILILNGQNFSQERATNDIFQMRWENEIDVLDAVEESERIRNNIFNEDSLIEGKLPIKKEEI